MLFIQWLFLPFLRYKHSGAWCSHQNNQNQWIQAEFGTPFKITAIQTQGRSDGNSQWVKSYKLSYGNDGIHWSDVSNKYGEEMVRLRLKIPCMTKSIHLNLKKYVNYI